MADDNYIDKLVGDALKGYNVPYNEAHWAAMQQLMHRHKRRRIIVWWGSVAASLLIMLGAGLLWYSIAPNAGLQENQLTSTEETDISKPEKAADDQLTEEKVGQASDQPVMPATKPESSKTHLSDRNKIQEAETDQPDSRLPKVNEAEIAELKKEEIGKSESDKGGAHQAPISRATQHPSLASTYADAHSYADFMLEPLPAHSISSSVDLSHYYLAAAASAELGHRKRIWIEASGTATANIVSNVLPGYQAGMMAGMEVAPRIHTGAGIGFSQMQYNEAAAGDTVNGFMHIGTEGMFRFVELPLQVSVHNRVRPKLTTWISAALVNLFPVREQYTMEYVPAPAYPIGTSNFNSSTFETTVIKDGNPRYAVDSQFPGNSLASESSFSSYNPRSWYGMGQVTAGLGYNIAPGMELTASASYRFPLQGMGLESQKIHAPGIQLGLRYYLQ